MEVLALRVILRVKKQVSRGEMILHGSILDGKRSHASMVYLYPSCMARPGICAVGKLDWGVSAPKGTKDLFQACLNHQLEATVDGVSADVWCTALEHTTQMTSFVGR
jgi:hypothetical protein